MDLDPVDPLLIGLLDPDPVSVTDPYYLSKI